MTPRLGFDAGSAPRGWLALTPTPQHVMHLSRLHPDLSRTGADTGAASLCESCRRAQVSSQVDVCPQRCLEVHYAFKALGPHRPKARPTDHPPPPPSHRGWPGRASLCVSPREGGEGTGLSATGPLLARGASGSQRDHPPNLPRRWEPAPPTRLCPQEIPSPSHWPLKTLPSPPHTHFCTWVPGSSHRCQADGSWTPPSTAPSHLRGNFSRALAQPADLGVRTLMRGRDSCNLRLRVLCAPALRRAGKFLLTGTGRKWQCYCLVLPPVADSNSLLLGPAELPWRTW